MNAEIKDWAELTALTQGKPVVVERVRMADSGIAIEGRFELPQLARLSAEDQVFVVAFVRSHGSIKEMERVFGVSYPTIKARLTRIGNSFEFVEAAIPDVQPDARRDSKSEIMARLKRGEIDADTAIRELEALR